MNLKSVRLFALALLLGVSVWLLVVATAQGEPATASYGPEATAAAWTRTLEPVILSGAQLPGFDGAPIGDLFVYAFEGGAWQQIPFQIDEMDATGVYTTGDGLLDGNDELVFMGQDLAAQAGPGDWVADTDAQSHERYEVRVTNPLNTSEVAWAYVYRSASLVPSFADYVQWDAVNARVVAGTYIVGYAPGEHAGMESLELNGTGVDVLDRTKIRVPVTCYIAGEPFEEVATEEDMAGRWDVNPSVDGAVRVGGGSAEASVWSYRSMYESDALFDLSALPADRCDTLVIHSMRISGDWSDPVASGMAPAKHYDDNTPAGVAIDGVPDTVAATPVNTWKQTSGARGTVVQVQDVSAAGGTLSNYYIDDATPFEDPPPTGDGLQYGDAGFLVDDPDGEITFRTTNFVLPANQPNVGGTYRSYHDHPLQVSATAQEVCWAQGVSVAYSPFPVYAGAATAFTAAVEAGQAPFTYAWEFGDGGTGSGSPASHTFAAPGVYSVTVAVTNVCGTTETARIVLVFAPGQAHVVYLPLVQRNAH